MVKYEIEVVFFATSGITVRHFMLKQIDYFRSHGLNVAVCSSDDYGVRKACAEAEIPFYPLPMQRDPSPLQDCVALFRLCCLLTRVRPKMVVYGTPKASLLCATAAWLTRIPIRIYQLRGLRLETSSGAGHAFLKQMEKITSILSTKIIANSPSLRNLYVEMGLSTPEKIFVIGDGSSNGVDSTHFRDGTCVEKVESKKIFGLSENSFVLGFVGRLSKDKGVDRIITMGSKLRNSGVELLLVGPDEGEASAIFDNSEIKAVVVPYVEDPRIAYWAMDILIFPSLREGFPNVVLEAAACAIPTIGLRATGTIDAVLHDKTGWLFSVECWDEAEYLVNSLITEQRCVLRAGQRARKRVEDKFVQRSVWEKYRNFYLCEISES